ncbi:MAG: hypothetical protein WCJ56_10550 [bacterium]
MARFACGGRQKLPDIRPQHCRRAGSAALGSRTDQREAPPARRCLPRGNIHKVPVVPVVAHRGQDQTAQLRHTVRNPHLVPNAAIIDGQYSPAWFRRATILHHSLLLARQQRRGRGRRGTRHRRQRQHRKQSPLHK